MEPIVHKTVIGLDMGQHAVKAVRAVRRGTGVRLTHLETLRMPPGMGGAEQAVLVSRWLEQQGFKGEPCVIGLRGLSVLFQTLSLAAEDPRPAEQAVELEIARLSEISTESMLHGFVPISGGEAGARRFLIGLVRAEVADGALVAGRGAGVDVVDMAPTPAAACHTAVAARRGTGCVVVADIGLGGTDVAVAGPGGMRFARSFGIGGQFFTESLARARRITASQAEPVKVSAGLEGADATGKEALTAAAENWAAELKSCLAIYRSFYPDSADQPVELILTGGGARLKGLERFLAYKLGLETRVLSALPGASDQAGGAADAATFAVACGLALAGAGVAGPFISLLPGDLREAMLLRRQKGYWLGAAALAGLILATSLYGGYRDHQRKTAELTERKNSLSRRQALRREIEGVRAGNARLDAMAGAVQTLLRNGPVFRDVVSALAERLETNCWITLVADANTYFAQENLVKPEARRAPRGISPRERKEGEPAVLLGEARFSRLIVEGYTSDASFAAVQKLIDSLKAAGSIQKADLLGDDQLVEEDTEKWGVAGGKRFVIDLTL